MAQAEALTGLDLEVNQAIESGNYLAGLSQPDNHPQFLNVTTSEFDQAVAKGECPFLNGLGNTAIEAMRESYQIIEQGDLKGFKSLIDNLAESAKQKSLSNEGSKAQIDPIVRLQTNKVSDTMTVKPSKIKQELIDIGHRQAEIDHLSHKISDEPSKIIGSSEQKLTAKPNQANEQLKKTMDISKRPMQQPNGPNVAKTKPKEESSISKPNLIAKPNQANEQLKKTMDISKRPMQQPNGPNVAKTKPKEESSISKPNLIAKPTSKVKEQLGAIRPNSKPAKQNFQPAFSWLKQIAVKPIANVFKPKILIEKPDLLEKSIDINLASPMTAEAAEVASDNLPIDLSFNQKEWLVEPYQSTDETHLAPEGDLTSAIKADSLDATAEQEAAYIVSLEENQVKVKIGELIETIEDLEPNQSELLLDINTSLNRLGILKEDDPVDEKADEVSLVEAKIKHLFNSLKLDYKEEDIKQFIVLCQNKVAQTKKGLSVDIVDLEKLGTHEAKKFKNSFIYGVSSRNQAYLLVGRLAINFKFN